MWVIIYVILFYKHNATQKTCLDVYGWVDYVVVTMYYITLAVA